MPRALKVCSCVSCAAHSGSCPTLVKAGRCTDCAREVEQRRGSRQQRGYDREHERTRERLLPAAYGKPCPGCGQPMLRGQALDLGHSTDLRHDPTARGDRIEHASCNRAWRRGERDVK